MIYGKILAKENPNLNVFSITPGFIATDMSADYQGDRKPEDPFKAAEVAEYCVLNEIPEKTGKFIRIKKGEVSIEPYFQ